MEILKPETITPEIAARILQANSHNRPVRPSVVKRYAQQMKNGEWRLTGEAIKIASNGALLDGQHRLLACLESQQPFEVYMITGLPPDIFDILDTGTPRRVPDVLHIAGEHSVNLLAASLGWIYRFENKGWREVLKGPR